MLIGYARVSTQDQTLDLQTDALTRAGCEKIFTDTTSGAKSERPGLQEAMNHLRAGDTLVVWRLDRLGRTLKHLIATIADLSDKGIGFKSLQENMDIPRQPRGRSGMSLIEIVVACTLLAVTLTAMTGLATKMAARQRNVAYTEQRVATLYQEVNRVQSLMYDSLSKYLTTDSHALATFSTRLLRARPATEVHFAECLEFMESLGACSSVSCCDQSFMMSS